MIQNSPNWVNWLFIITCSATIAIFYAANGKPKKLTVLIIVWSLSQSILAYLGFYQLTLTAPYRFGLVLIPTTLFIIYGLLPKQQKWFFEKRKTKVSTFLHTARLPIEIVLFVLFTNNMITELMTFNGRNYDILIGITAPFFGWLFLARIVGKKTLLIWNVLGFLFVLFILINGILSAELPFQQFGFEQPNRGITYFPFILLPAVIIPIVIWTHLSDIIKLKKELRLKA